MKTNKTKASKSEEVKKQLMIDLDKLEEGKRLPSEPDLAREYGVSRSTIGRSISSLENDGMLRRRQGSGTYIVRKPSAIELGQVRNFAFAMSSNVCLEKNAFYHDILAGAEAELAKENGILSIIRLPGEISSYDDFFCQLTGYDGLILVGEVPLSFIKYLQGTEMDFVLLDTNPEVDDVDIVATDNVQGAFEAVKYLFDHGFSSIGFFGATEFISHHERFQGYRLALAELNLIFSEQSCIQEVNPESTEEDILSFLKARELPKAFFCANDSYAFKLIQGLKSLDCQIPAEISIIGFDDDQLAEFSSPSLTTMHVDKSRMGRLAVKKLNAAFQGDPILPRKLYLHSRLIERESVEGRSSE